MSSPDARLRSTVRIVCLLNLAYFGVEFSVARLIGSVSLYADSIDFLEDAAVNLLILIAIGWSAYRRSVVGMVLAGLLVIPGALTLWAAYQKFLNPIAPDAAILSLAGLGALTINLYCAFRLARYRTHSGSLTRAAFLSARNDAFANIAIISAGLITVVTLSPWPDLVVGVGIFLLNLDAAREVFSAARDEHLSAARA